MRPPQGRIRDRLIFWGSGVKAETPWYNGGMMTDIQAQLAAQQAIGPNWTIVGGYHPSDTWIELRRCGPDDDPELLGMTLTLEYDVDPGHWVATLTSHTSDSRPKRVARVIYNDFTDHHHPPFVEATGEGGLGDLGPTTSSMTRLDDEEELEVSEEDFETFLAEAIEVFFADESDEVDHADVATFRDCGVLTMNRGLVVTIGDSEFQLTIVRSR